MTDTFNFEMMLNSAIELPMVKIEREEYLRKELSKKFDPIITERAIIYNPAQAGIPVDEIDEIAKGSIEYETSKVSILSFVAGIPGGIAMTGTIPADFTQFFVHIIRVAQKLSYLYGWGEISLDASDLDDESRAILTLFAGVMFGVEGANKALSKLCEGIAAKVERELFNKALTKGMIYPIVKETGKAIGVKVTKDVFSKAVGKVIPFIGGVISGGITYISFKEMANKLKNHLSTLNYANPEFYAS